MKLIEMRHPHYQRSVDDWALWRSVYEGGRQFIDRHLKQFSKREDLVDFATRRELTPCPAFASSAIEDIINNIYQRMPDITRTGGPSSYMDCLNGMNSGVDLLGNSMNYFIGKILLPELLVLGKVGVYVDMPSADGVTLWDIKELKIRPYLYLFSTESILNWTIDHSDRPNAYTSLLLRENFNQIDENFGLPVGEATRYRYMYINEFGTVNVEWYNEENVQVDLNGLPTWEPAVLNMQQIPFVPFHLPYSLLRDAARYQVALLNMLSSDINYCLKSNFPFYIEEMDERPGPTRTEGSQTQANVGTTSGRAYGRGLNPPAFINPSPDPLRASMDKQEQMKAEIRQVINLAVTQLNPDKQASAESKSLDNQGLEAGLSSIGFELERGERKIGEFWSLYGKNTPPTINYPESYSLKSDTERQTEAENYCALIPAFPSKTYQKEVAKVAVRKLIGHKVSIDTVKKIEAEIEAAEIIAVDPKTIVDDVTAGFLDKANAAKARLYPADAVAKANEEHAQRLKIIAANQMPGQARGNADGSADPNQGKLEKVAANDGSNDPIPQDKSRGAGK